MTARRFDIADARRRLTGRHGRTLWAGIEEIVDEDAFRQWVEAEFPAAMPALLPGGRRRFLKLMGASLLLGGLSACAEEPADRGLPYVNQPERAVPGVPRLYATAIPFEGYLQPVIATTHDGRPTKLDGNPDYTVSRGASDPFTQAAVLQLYDPDRSQTPLHEGLPSTWAAWQRALVEMRRDWTARKGEGLRFLSGEITSPTLIRQLQALFSELPAARLHILEPVGLSLQAQAMRLCFGREVDQHYQLEKCERIVSLEADLLGPGARQVAHARAWSQRRGEAIGAPLLMHVAESTPSLTGVAATTRLACDTSRVIELARRLAAEFGIGQSSADSLSETETHWVQMAAAALRDHAGRSLLAIGSHLPAAVQALGPAINERLQNIGATVWYSEPVRFRGDQEHPFADLAEDIANGGVDTLIVIDANPIYAAPADLGFAELLRRVRNRIHTALYNDETGRACAWHLPLAHALESWSDGRAIDGTTSIIQPTLAPLYEARTVHQFLAMLQGKVDPSAEEPVRGTWMETFGADFDTKWRRSLHDGFLADTAAKAVMVTPRADEAPAAHPGAPGEIEVVFRPDPCIWDGRFANVAWLQELPKPLSKLTWGNAVAVSPALAERMHLANGDMVAVSVAGREVAGPAWITPGQAADTVVLTLGHGRAAGSLAEHVGYSGYAVRTAAAPWHAFGTLRSAEGRESLATTQLHHQIDGFDLVREVTPDHPTLDQKAETQPSLYAPWPSSSEAWGMAIDLDRCIGCNACIAACTAENNVPVVGKEQVAMGREMHWLRVDLYHRGAPDDPRFYFQPVPCMHCEKAPCEMGCPVHATVHSPDGINQMVYNRCIGTRTCSSYCPYKVRRFNWYDYRAAEDSPTHAAHNPDVTVRSRGVMEKCSYCTQRIQAARVAADKENRALREGEVVTACQQACPTTAIVFGNINDPHSAVAQLRRSGRHYRLLEELGTRPRTTYLARRNDAPDKGSS